MRSLILAAVLGLGLAACATETPYQPQTVRGGYGYSEHQIESNRYRVQFQGNSLTDRETVENYLLYRAAELTVEHGYDYFIVADRGVHGQSHLSPVGGYYPAFAPNYWYFTRRGWMPFYDPFFDSPMAYREITRYEASAEIAMFHGAKPADNASAFNAREVADNLRDRVTRPPSP